jgi:hypothetical protein
MQIFMGKPDGPVVHDGNVMGNTAQIIVASNSCIKPGFGSGC